MATLWLLVIYGAVESSLRGPYASDSERIKEAQRFMRDLTIHPADSVHRLDIDLEGQPNVSPFLYEEISKDV